MNAPPTRVSGLARHALLTLALCGGCLSDQNAPVDPQLGGTKYPNVGLYTPGSTLGLMQQQQNPPPSDAGNEAGADDVNGDRCKGSPSDTGSGGLLTVNFTTVNLGGKYSPKNVGAVWIEGADGTYIKTLERWAAIRALDLIRWGEHACTAKWPEADAITAATINTNKPHQSSWSGKDFNGKLVPDGTYVLWIEVNDREFDYGPYVTYEFEKGTKPVTLTPPDKPPCTGLKIDFMPNSSDE